MRSAIIASAIAAVTVAQNPWAAQVGQPQPQVFGQGQMFGQAQFGQQFGQAGQRIVSGGRAGVQVGAGAQGQAAPKPKYRDVCKPLRACGRTPKTQQQLVGFSDCIAGLGEQATIDKACKKMLKAKLAPLRDEAYAIAEAQEAAKAEAESESLAAAAAAVAAEIDAEEDPYSLGLEDPYSLGTDDDYSLVLPEEEEEEPVEEEEEPVEEEEEPVEEEEEEPVAPVVVTGNANVVLGRPGVVPSGVRPGFSSGFRPGVASVRPLTSVAGAGVRPGVAPNVYSQGGARVSSQGGVRYNQNYGYNYGGRTVQYGR